MANVIEVEDISIYKDSAWKSIRDQKAYVNGKWENISDGSGVYKDNNWYVFKKLFQSWSGKDIIFRIGAIYYAGTVVADNINEMSGKRDIVIETTSVAQVGTNINEAPIGIILVSGVAMPDVISQLGTPSNCVINGRIMNLKKGMDDEGNYDNYWLWTGTNGYDVSDISQLGYFDWVLCLDGNNISTVTFDTPLVSLTVTNSPTWTEALAFGVGCFSNLAKTQQMSRPMIFLYAVAQTMQDFIFRSPVLQNTNVTKLNSMQVGGSSPITLNMTMTRVYQDKIHGTWPSDLVGQINQMVGSVTNGVDATLVLNFDSMQQIFVLKSKP
jgi:hypothetical protein